MSGVLDEADPHTTDPTRNTITSGACNKNIRSATLPVSSPIATGQSDSPDTCVSSSSLNQVQFMNVYLTQTLPKVRTPPYIRFLTNSSAFSHQQGESVNKKQAKGKHKASKSQKPELCHEGHSLAVEGRESVSERSHSYLDNNSQNMSTAPEATSALCSLNASNLESLTSQVPSYMKSQYSNIKFRQQSIEPTVGSVAVKHLAENRQRSANTTHSALGKKFDLKMSETVNSQNDSSARRQQCGVEVSFPHETSTCSNDFAGVVNKMSKANELLLETQRDWNTSDGPLFEG